MKYDRTESFDRDFKKLPPNHQAAFREAAVTFSDACDVYINDPGRGWPSNLRVKPMRGYDGIWEMTWSFTGPDGRATFEWIADQAGELVVVWRRVGDHRIYDKP